jgi:SAM-dependent methyltransferase
MTEVIDVRALMKEYSIDSLNRSAEGYFVRFLDHPDAILAKPFNDIGEMTEVLLTFCHTLEGLEATRGMTILDFGAGSCWSSRYLTQLGYRVIASDVSESALELGKMGYRRFPPTGNAIEPRFMHFDGYRFDLPDQSVDRIMCLSAFHHVPNQRQILSEMYRVLKEGGIAGFSEPGPHHSRSAAAQHEMRNFTVVENDILLEEEVWPLAQSLGFQSIQLGIWTPFVHLVPLQTYNQFLEGNDEYLPHRIESKNLLRERRLFFLRKGWPGLGDSQQPNGLKAALHLNLTARRVHSGMPVEGTVTAKNIGNAVWLPSHSKIGPVRVGTRLLDTTGRLVHEGRFFFPKSERGGIFPKEIARCDIHLPPLPRGVYRLEVDLISENVCWFQAAGTGSETVRSLVDVI